MKLLRNLAILAILLAAAPGWAALPDAVRFGARLELGDADAARQWLDEGLDPNFVADRIGTGLMIGAWIGNIPLMELFAARGADVNRANGFGETALMHAAWRGQTDAVKWLLARGAKINRDGNEWSALHYAAFAGHGEVVRLLLERGANIDAKSPNGSSVLMMAVYEGQADVARLLVERGADRTVRNEAGASALDWAVKYNRPDIAGIVGTADALADAASRARARPAPRSQWEGENVEELLRIRRILESRGISLAAIDRRVAAMRARNARAAQTQPARMPALEIGARRSAPTEQTIELLYR